MKINRKFILASQSPRRKELLEMIGLDFTIDPSDFDEHDNTGSPQSTAIHNAEGKAKEVAQRHPDALILGVDTVVYCRDRILGKPKDEADARRILNLLSGSTHEVISALCLIDSKTGATETATSTTEVTIDQLTPQQIEDYIACGEGADKAAGYAIQGLGALFVREIKGDYFNVVGLPLYSLNKMLESSR